MDLVRTELLPNVLIRDMQREARHWALAEQAASRDRRPAVAAHVGVLLVRVGRRIESAGRRLAAPSLPALPIVGGCGDEIRAQRM